MSNLITNKFFIFFISISTLLFSCSSSSDDDSANDDDSGNTGNFIELSDNDLGTYDGDLVPLNNIENTQEVIVTVIETGDRTYTIDFNDIIPSLTEVQFIEPVVETDNNIILSVSDLDNDGFTVVFIDSESGIRTITINIANSDEANDISTFVGRKQ